MDTSRDEQSIRNLIAEWLHASLAGDTKTQRRLMDTDVVFLRPNHPPVRGRDAAANVFASASGRIRIESAADIQEIQVSGDLGYCWSHLKATVTPSMGGTSEHAGFVLTVLRKQADGAWAIYRDANMMTRLS